MRWLITVRQLRNKLFFFLTRPSALGIPNRYQQEELR